MSNTSIVTIPVEIQEFRKIQENVQTPGPKCNRDFYDIIWDKAYSESIYGIGKNKPFEMNKQTIHICPKDAQENYITRKGYTKDNITGKVIWIGTGIQAQTFTAQPLQQHGQQQQQQQFATAIGSSDISAQIGGLTNSIQQLMEAYEKVSTKQYDEIVMLRVIIDEYIRHNPLESSFLELTKRMMSYLPEPELGPKRADQYKVGFESAE